MLFIAMRLEFQAADVFHVRRLPGAVERHDDGQTDGDFGRGHGDDEEDEDLRVVVGQAVSPTWNRENATSERLAAFSISSSDMKMMMILRRSITPAKPIVKSSPLTIR